jgi:hypothetical protein
MRRSHLCAVASVFLLSSAGAAVAGPFGGGGPGLPGGGGGGGGAPSFSRGGLDRDIRPRTPPSPRDKNAVRRLDRSGPAPNPVPPVPVSPRP